MPLAHRSRYRDCRKIGVGLQRPEDVVVGRDGRVWASDQQSACAQIRARRHAAPRRQGRRRAERHQHGRRRAASSSPTSRPGRVQRLDVESGAVEIICSEVAGRTLTASNYPILDRNGDDLVRQLDLRASLAAGARRPRRRHAVPHPPRRPRRADGRGHPVRQRPGARCRRVAHLRLPDDRLQRDPLPHPVRRRRSARAEPYGPVLGTPFPRDVDPDNLPAPERMAQVGLTDGCGFDVEGNLWVTLVAANRIVAITPRGDVVPIIEDRARRADAPTNQRHLGRRRHARPLHRQHHQRLRHPRAQPRRRHAAVSSEMKVQDRGRGFEHDPTD